MQYWGKVIGVAIALMMGGGFWGVLIGLIAALVYLLTLIMGLNLSWSLSLGITLLLMELFFAAGIIYLLLSWVILFSFRLFEKRMNRHTSYVPPDVMTNTIP